MITIIQDDKNPSAPEIVDAFLHSYDAVPTTVLFHTSKVGAVVMKITGLDYESGMPGMFLIRGFSDEFRLEGFYDANNRMGTLQQK